MSLRKHFNLYYIFQEDKERFKMSREKSLEIWRMIEKLFCTLSNKQPILPENIEKELVEEGEQKWKEKN